MKDYFRPVKEFDYAAFIEELKALIEQAKVFDVIDGGTTATSFALGGTRLRA